MEVQEPQRVRKLRELRERGAREGPGHHERARGRVGPALLKNTKNTKIKKKKRKTLTNSVF